MDYNSLLARVVDTLGSQITTAQAANLVELVEARFNRIIDHPMREATTTYTNPTGDIVLPTDCWRLRDMWLVGTPDTTLEQLSPDAARTLYGRAVGNPLCYAISGRNIDLFPTPTSTFVGTIKARYQQTIPALGPSNLTNWLIESHPDIYYYALLLQAEAYIVNDERLAIWKGALDEALGELEAVARRQRYGVSPLVRRPYHAA